MRPIDFPETNRTIGCHPGARDYGADMEATVEPVRAFVTSDGVVTELWRPTWRERLSMLIFGRVWVDLLTGDGRPQPIAIKGTRTVFATERETTPRLWFLGIFGALALLAALTADGQTCPDLPPECGRLPCPYRAAQVTPAQQSALIAETGPWVLIASQEPLPGMAREYATVEDWRRAAWGQPANLVTDKLYCPVGEPCGFTVRNAFRVALKIVKPNREPGGCTSYTGDHAFAKSAWTVLYGREPTLGEWWELECHENRGGHWIVDLRLSRALLCLQEGGPPPPVPPSPPVPVPPPLPPPPEPPSCEPYEGSACESRCLKGADAFGGPWGREWCLDSARPMGPGQIGRLCASVCRGGEPGEPDEPEPEEPELPTPELECWTGTVTGRFIPGIPSTGRLEVEMFRVDCPEGSP